MIKNCIICNKEFRRKGNYKTCSDMCQKINYDNKVKECSKKYRLKNLTKYKETLHSWYLLNKEKHNKYMKIYHKNNKEQIKQQRQIHYEQTQGHKQVVKKNCLYCNKEFYTKYDIHKCCSEQCQWRNNSKKHRSEKIIKICKHCNKEFLTGLKHKKFCTKLCYKQNIQKRIKDSLSARVVIALKSNDIKKNNNTLKLLGCSLQQFKEHIQNKFQPNMSWDNYGLKGWHIDHIIPCDSFDLSVIENQYKCFHYTNLQPLWWYDNLQKTNKIMVTI